MRYCQLRKKFLNTIYTNTFSGCPKPSPSLCFFMCICLYVPQKRLIGLLYDVVTGDKFEVAIMTVIMCNMVMMMIQHHGQSSQVTTVLHILLPRQVFSFVSYFHKVRFLICIIYPLDSAIHLLNNQGQKIKTLHTLF